MSLRRPLILVGLPGSGKSTVGRLAAGQLGVPFVDFDAALVARTGLTIPQLFAQQGEANFRKLEYELTLELLEAPPGVWAPGGGWVTAPGALALVASRSCMIHLDVSSSTALARLRSDATIRPLLVGGEAQQTLDRLGRERASRYAEADHRLPTDGIAVEQVVGQVIAIALADSGAAGRTAR